MLGCSKEPMRFQSAHDVKAMVSGDDGHAELSPEDRADKQIREAKAAKAHMLATKGTLSAGIIDTNKRFVHSAMVDEDYLLVALHVDSITFGKIVRGEYVDFAKLLPKDKVLQEEENKLEVVMRGGKTFWVLVNETANITNFSKWEQVFRVFSDIYNRHHPERSTELIQYNHIIHTAALTYTWDNVYSYDKDFRLHMSCHPERSWGIILQQAWAMRLKDKQYRNDYDRGGHTSHQHKQGYGRQSHHNGGNDRRSFNVNDICRRFNKMKCTAGSSCQYEHLCLYCFKFGHAIANCWKLAADKAGNNKSGTYDSKYSIDRREENRHHSDGKHSDK